MQKIEFILDKKSYQKASFRKYLDELRTDKRWQRGALVLLSFVAIVSILKFLFLQSSIIQYTYLTVLGLFIFFLLLVFFGNYSTWKDGGKIFDEVFAESGQLFFSYDSKYFIYGNDSVNRRYSWNSITSLFVFSNLNMVTLEDKDRDHFYLKISNEQLEKLESFISQMEIPIKYI